jgi:hypothetical protein
MPEPPGVQVRAGPQNEAALQSSSRMQAAPSATHPHGWHVPAVHVRPPRHATVGPQAAPTLAPGGTIEVPASGCGAPGAGPSKSA